jgi:hypothetical protein
VAVACPDGMIAARAVLKGANPNRRLRAMLRPPGVVRDQAEAPVADGKGFGVVLPHPLPLSICNASGAAGKFRTVAPHLVTLLCDF